MLGVDDGIWNGNLNAADVFFLLAVILAALAALAYAASSRPVQEGRIAVGVWGPVLGWLSVACLAFGWLVL